MVGIGTKGPIPSNPHTEGKNEQKGEKRDMCIMEVHAGQRSSTIAQALAHNTYTILGDMDMFLEVLEARKDDIPIDQVQQAQDHLKRAYAILLTAFGLEVANEVMDHEGHVHDNASVSYDNSDGTHTHTPRSGQTYTHDNHDEIGHERTFVEQAHHDAQLGRKFMTR